MAKTSKQKANMLTSETPLCVLELISLARAACSGDHGAGEQLRLAGELLDLAGGAKAMCDVQGTARDWLKENGGWGGPDLAGVIGSHWGHIPAWSAL